jgi:hypothetical protein
MFGVSDVRALRYTSRDDRVGEPVVAPELTRQMVRMIGKPFTPSIDSRAVDRSPK